MKQINYSMGLPRSGTTLLMNIIQQNPKIFTTATCPTPYLVSSAKETAQNVSEFIAMDQDQLNKCCSNFLQYGIQGWFSALTDKPVVFTKSRPWAEHLDTIFSLNNNSKVLVILRDLRGIINSFEKLLNKYTIWDPSYEGKKLRHTSIDERIKIYCLDNSGNLGRPLSFLPLVYEISTKRPNSFYFLRIEDFSNNPQGTMDSIYQWLGMETFQHDLNNIKQSTQFEHDTIYRSLVSHKTKSNFTPDSFTSQNQLTMEQNYAIILNNQWYYSTFYPEIYNEFTKLYPTSGSK